MATRSWRFSNRQACITPCQSRFEGQALWVTIFNLSSALFHLQFPLPIWCKLVLRIMWTMTLRDINNVCTLELNVKLPQCFNLYGLLCLGFSLHLATGYWLRMRAPGLWRIDTGTPVLSSSMVLVQSLLHWPYLWKITTTLARSRSFVHTLKR